jgi:hypothetical protein
MGETPKTIVLDLHLPLSSHKVEEKARKNDSGKTQMITGCHYRKIRQPVCVVSSSVVSA